MRTGYFSETKWHPSGQGLPGIRFTGEMKFGQISRRIKKWRNHSGNCSAASQTSTCKLRDRLSLFGFVNLKTWWLQKDNQIEKKNSLDSISRRKWLWLSSCILLILKFDHVFQYTVNDISHYRLEMAACNLSVNKTCRLFIDEWTLVTFVVNVQMRQELSG